MYRITITIQNLVTGLYKQLPGRFDPVTITQTKWNNKYPAVKAEIDALKAESDIIEAETPTW
jgi:hypothetical protein